MGEKALLEARDLAKSYHDGERELKVLQGASLAVNRGQAVAVVGMSGSGKSTLMHLLGGLDVPDAGQPPGKLHRFVVWHTSPTRQRGR